MDFFGIGPLEVILIIIIGLLIFGPQKLPQMARDIGKAFSSFKKASMNLTAEIEKELDDVKKEVKNITSEEDLQDVKKGLESFKKELQDIKPEKELTDVKKGLESFKKELQDIKPERELTDVKKGLESFKKELVDIKSEKEPNSKQPDQKIVEAEKPSNPESIEGVG